MHHVDILAADIFVDLDESLPIWKWFDAALAKLDANVIANGVGERLVGCSAEYFHWSGWVI